MSDDRLHIHIEKAIKDFRISLATDIHLDQVTAIFGESGSGKTSVLNLIAGLMRPDTGHIKFRDAVWYSARPSINAPIHKRGIGYLFQDGRLFTHLDVRGNLKYADIRSQNTATSKSAQPIYSFDDIVAACDLSALLDRDVHALSGGERQRVALARTFLTRPRLLLCDEPLSALDTARKVDVLPFIERLPRRFNIPLIYVSHDVGEVSRIADHVIVLERGRIKGESKTHAAFAHQVLSAARNPFETVSKLAGRVDKMQTELGLMSVKLKLNDVWLPLHPSYKVGDSVEIVIPARDVSISRFYPKGLSIQTVLKAHIVSAKPLQDSAFMQVNLDVSGQNLTARITQKAWQDLSLKPDMKVYALIKSAVFSS